MRADLALTFKKVCAQATKDFVVWPLLSGPSFRRTLTANLTACVLRNLWSHSVIMCGHSPRARQVFEPRQSLDPDESRGHW